MEEKILYLPLKKKWYEMIESGEKPLYTKKREMSITRSFAENKNFETSFRKMWR